MTTLDILYVCQLCHRIGVPQSNHHLIPKSRNVTPNKANIVSVCVDCHNSIHAFFTNKELEKTYHSIDSLLSNQTFARHIKWLAKQNPNTRYKSKMVKEKKSRGRSG